MSLTATCQANFEQGVAFALHLWPALTLSVQNNWGGADSADKRDWFAGAVVDLFPDLAKPKINTQQAPAQATQDDAAADDAGHGRRGDCRCSRPRGGARDPG